MNTQTTRNKTLKITILSVLFVFFLCGTSSAIVKDIRTGTISKGVRLVADLDRESDYKVVKKADQLVLSITTPLSGKLQGNFPDKSLVRSYSAKRVGVKTEITINMVSSKVSWKVFSLYNPFRVVLDIFTPSTARTIKAKVKTPVLKPLSAVLNKDSAYILKPLPVSGKKSAISSMRSVLDVKDGVYEGIFTSKEYYFDISPIWKLEDPCYVELLFSHSELTDPSLSNFTVYINEVPMASLKLDKDNVWYKKVRVKLPREYLKVGVNTLTIGVFQKATRVKCSDVDNTGNWFRIHKESNVFLSYQNKGDLNLSDFPSPWFEKNQWLKEDTAFIVPDKTETDEIEAVFDLITWWARIVNFKDISPLVLRSSEITEDISRSYHMIYLGRKSAFPEQISKSFYLQEKFKEGAYVSAFVNPYGKGRMLITGTRASDVLLGTKAMMNKSTREQMTGRKAHILPDLPLIDEVPLLKTVFNDITISDTGLSDIVFQGTYGHVANVGFRIPSQWVVKGSPSFILKYHYSPSLNPVKSTITVSVNGVPQKSTVLLPKGSSSGRLEVPLPLWIKGGEFIDIDISAYLDIDTYDCAHNYTEAAWAVVERSSYLHIPHDIAERKPLLEYLPFNLEGDKPLKLLIQKGASSEAITVLAQSLLRWQKNITSNLSFDVSYLSAEVIDSTSGSNRVILAPIEVMKNSGFPLEIRYDSKRKKILSGEKVPVLSDFADKACYLQLYPGEGALTLLLGWIKYMPDQEIFRRTIINGDIRGDVALVAPDGRIVSFYVNEKNVLKNDNVTSTYGWRSKLNLLTQDVRLYLAVFVLLCVFLVIVIIAMVYKFGKK